MKNMFLLVPRTTDILYVLTNLLIEDVNDLILLKHTNLQRKYSPGHPVKARAIDFFPAVGTWEGFLSYVF